MALGEGKADLGWGGQSCQLPPPALPFDDPASPFFHLHHSEGTPVSTASPPLAITLLAMPPTRQETKDAEGENFAVQKYWLVLGTWPILQALKFCIILRIVKSETVEFYKLENDNPK